MMNQTSDKEKWNRAVSIVAESVLKPDSDLRHHAHEQECYHELMYVREMMLEHLQTLRK